MKELTTLNNEFTESEEKKENNFSSSRNFDFTCIHFDIYECLKWLEKPLWLINIKLYDVIVTDKFHNNRSQESQSVHVKKVFLAVSQYPQESVYVGVFY